MSAERDSLLAREIEARWPTYGQWSFEYEYPGFFCYSREGFSLYFTPDFNDEGALDIQLQDGSGECIDPEGLIIPYGSVPYGDPLTAEFMHAEAVKAMDLADAAR